MKNSAFVLSLVVVAALTAVACGPKAAPPVQEPAAPVATEPAPAAAPVTATATLTSVAGKNVTGTVTFTEEGGTVHVAAHVEGVEPGGLHGFHLHEKGDCSAPDFTSAGGHLNPADAPHGCPADAIRHAGDFGNIEVGADGTGHLDLTTDLITLGDGANSAVGKAVILHAGEDDCVTQPTGNAGTRLACGVVEKAAAAAAAADGTGSGY